MKKIILLLVSFLVLTQSAYGASDRYLIESNLTTIAQDSLDSMFGENNFIARVQVLMTDSQYRVQYTKESDAKTKSKNNNSDEQVYILPGIPALKNIAPDSLKQLPFDSVTTLVEPKIRRILVTVLVNKSYPRRQANRAQSMLKDILRLNEKRGDRINLEFIPFYNVKSPGKSPSATSSINDTEPESLFSISNILMIILIGLLLLFILVYSRYQSKLLEKSGDSDSGGPSINVNPNLELPEGFGQGGSGSDMNINVNSDVKRYFDFVNHTNIQDCVFLIKNQNFKPDYISLIISFLPSRLAAKVLSELSPELQAKIVSMLADQRLGSKDLLDKLEKKLKSDMECFVGGDSKIVELSKALKNSSCKSILDYSKKHDVNSYKKLRPNIVLFEDVLYLSDQDIQILLADLNLEQLATALINVDQTLFLKVTENLTKGARDMVNQYLELKSESSTNDQIEQAQDQIIQKLRKFVDQGKLNLSEKLKKA